MTDEKDKKFWAKIGPKKEKTVSIGDKFGLKIKSDGYEQFQLKSENLFLGSLKTFDFAKSNYCKVRFLCVFEHCRTTNIYVGDQVIDS